MFGTGCCTNLLELLKVRELPGLFEEGLFGAVEAEQDFKVAAGGRHPVGFFASRGLRAEADVYGSVGVGLHLGTVGGAAGP